MKRVLTLCACLTSLSNARLGNEGHLESPGVEDVRKRRLQHPRFYYDPYMTVKNGQAALAQAQGAPSVSAGPSGSAVPSPAPTLSPISEPPLGPLVVEFPSFLAPAPTIEEGVGPVTR